MDILISAVVAGMATSYLVELIGSVGVLSSRIVKLTLTLPLSILFLWFLGFTVFELIVGGLAAAFISLALLQFVNRPVTIANVSNRR